MRLKSSIPACLAVLTLSGCNLAIPDSVLQALTAAQTGKGGDAKTTDGKNGAQDKKLAPDSQTRPEGQPPKDPTMVAPQPGMMAPMMDPKQIFLQFDADRSQTWNLDEFRAFAMCGGPVPPPPPQNGGTIAVPPQPPQNGGTAGPTGTTTTSGTTRAVMQTAGTAVSGSATVNTGTMAPPPPDGQPTTAVMPMPPRPMDCDPTKTEGAFKEFDRNGDGQLQPEEAIAAIQKRMPPPPPGPNPVPPTAGTCEEDFARRDANGDKRVTWEEFYRPAPDMDPAAKDKAYAAFKEHDRNGDGAVDPAEFCGGNPPPVMPQPTDCQARLKAYDPDTDGKVSFDDYAIARYNELRFIQAPTEDEKRKQLEDFRAQGQKLDTNNDGALDYAELGIDCKL